MRTRILGFTLFASLLLPAAAQASFPHVVASGETLYSVAAADGLSVSQLAAANGLSPDAQLVAGTTLMIPPQGASTVSSTTPATGGEPDGDADDSASAVSTPVSAARSLSGAYVVAPGDTLSAIAARAGTTVAQLAVANGLDPNGILPAGLALRLSGSAGATADYVSRTSSAAVGQPVGSAAQGSMGAPPYPTPERVSASQVGSIASANGVPPALADAIGWQESGFNNDLVSGADARGVMQILPGTWNWIQGSLNPGALLAPASAADNVRGGVLLLHSLLSSTGGNAALAAAGYYQGLPSVQAHGMYSDTQRYVSSVLSLAQRFGGL